MQTSKVKQLWAANKPVINCWLSSGSAFVAEIMAEQGYDSLTIDLQHGMVGFDNALQSLQAMRASGVSVLTRVPWLEPGITMKLLDAGAHGIICPMINTAEQAARLVQYTRYPPIGSRSFGPARARITMGADYIKHANEQIMVLAMIETSEALANVDAIAATPGIDGLYIGPSDLTLGITNGRLGPGFDREEVEIVTAIKTILAAAKRASIRACLHCLTPKYAAKAIGWGFDMVTVSGDTLLIAAAAGDSVKELRGYLAS